VRERTDHQYLYAEAKKVKSLLHTHACLWANLIGLQQSIVSQCGCCEPGSGVGAWCYHHIRFSVL